MYVLPLWVLLHNNLSLIKPDSFIISFLPSPSVIKGSFHPLLIFNYLIKLDEEGRFEIISNLPIYLCHSRDSCRVKRPWVFGSSNLPPWVELSGSVVSIGKLSIIYLFVWRGMLSIINIRDIITAHTQHTNTFNTSWLHVEVQGNPCLQRFCLRSTVGQGLPFK